MVLGTSLLYFGVGTIVGVVIAVRFSGFFIAIKEAMAKQTSKKQETTNKRPINNIIPDRF